MCCKKTKEKQANSAAREGGARENNCAQRARRRAGFSLIEIMVVVVIIGLMAGAVAVGVNKYLDSAKRNRAKSDLAVIVTEIKGFYSMNSRYPTSDEGIDALKMDSGYQDPWGRPYQYLEPAAGNPDEPFEVFTLGQDGQPGGEGVDADIYSWQLNDADQAATP